LVLLPVGLFILYKAANESAIFDQDKYKKVFERLKLWFKFNRQDQSS